MSAPPTKRRPHLFAAVIACGLVVAVLFGTRMVAVHREHATVLSTAPELFPLKNQGLTFQRDFKNLMTVRSTLNMSIGIEKTSKKVFYR